MRVLVDTNIWLDILLNREVFAADSARAVSLLEGDDHEIFVGATTITTIFYLVGRARDAKTAWAITSDLLNSYSVAGVDGQVLRAASRHKTGDFEDWVLAEAARTAGVDAILTRDPTGFVRSGIPVHAPRALVGILSTMGG